MNNNTNESVGLPETEVKDNKMVDCFGGFPSKMYQDLYDYVNNVSSKPDSHVLAIVRFHKITIEKGLLLADGKYVLLEGEPEWVLKEVHEKMGHLSVRDMTQSVGSNLTYIQKLLYGSVTKDLKRVVDSCERCGNGGPCVIKGFDPYQGVKISLLPNIAGNRISVELEMPTPEFQKKSPEEETCGVRRSSRKREVKRDKNVTSALAGNKQTPVTPMVGVPKKKSKKVQLETAIDTTTTVNVVNAAGLQIPLADYAHADIMDLLNAENDMDDDVVVVREVVAPVRNFVMPTLAMMPSWNTSVTSRSPPGLVQLSSRDDEVTVVRDFPAPVPNVVMPVLELMPSWNTSVTSRNITGQNVTLPTAENNGDVHIHYTMSIGANGDLRKEVTLGSSVQAFERDVQKQVIPVTQMSVIGNKRDLFNRHVHMDTRGHSVKIRQYNSTVSLTAGQATARNSGVNSDPVNLTSVQHSDAPRCHAQKNVEQQSQQFAADNNSVVQTRDSHIRHVQDSGSQIRDVEALVLQPLIPSKIKQEEGEEEYPTVAPQSVQITASDNRDVQRRDISHRDAQDHRSRNPVQLHAENLESMEDTSALSTTVVKHQGTNGDQISIGAEEPAKREGGVNTSNVIVKKELVEALQPEFIKVEPMTVEEEVETVTFLCPETNSSVSSIQVIEEEEEHIVNRCLVVRTAYGIFRVPPGYTPRKPNAYGLKSRTIEHGTVQRIVHIFLRKLEYYDVAEGESIDWDEEMMNGAPMGEGYMDAGEYGAIVVPRDRDVSYGYMEEEEKSPEEETCGVRRSSRKREVKRDKNVTSALAGNKQTPVTPMVGVPKKKSKKVQLETAIDTTTTVNVVNAAGLQIPLADYAHADIMDLLNAENDMDDDVVVVREVVAPVRNFVMPTLAMMPSWNTSVTSRSPPGLVQLSSRDDEVTVVRDFPAPVPNVVMPVLELMPSWNTSVTSRNITGQNVTLPTAENNGDVHIHYTMSIGANGDLRKEVTLGSSVQAFERDVQKQVIPVTQMSVIGNKRDLFNRHVHMDTRGHSVKIRQYNSTVSLTAGQATARNSGVNSDPVNLTSVQHSDAPRCHAQKNVEQQSQQFAADNNSVVQTRDSHIRHVQDSGSQIRDVEALVLQPLIPSKIKQEEGEEEYPTVAPQSVQITASDNRDVQRRDISHRDAQDHRSRNPVQLHAENLESMEDTSALSTTVVKHQGTNGDQISIGAEEPAKREGGVNTSNVIVKKELVEALQPEFIKVEPMTVEEEVETVTFLCPETNSSVSSIQVIEEEEEHIVNRCLVVRTAYGIFRVPPGYTPRKPNAYGLKSRTIEHGTVQRIVHIFLRKLEYYDVAEGESIDWDEEMMNGAPMGEGYMDAGEYGAIVVPRDRDVSYGYMEEEEGDHLNIVLTITMNRK